MAIGALAVLATMLPLSLLLGPPPGAAEAGFARRSSSSPHFSSTGDPSEEFNRGDFPPGFVFGAGTSAYQVEGAVDEDGRSPSIWDTHTHAGKMFDGSTADVTADGYHKYKEDVKLMSETGLEAYRFSVSWSRLIPKGRGAINPKGLRYYNNLIDELVKHGIQPHVTLYHLDLPQVLEDEYAGWLSPRIVDDFTAYADVCFREFGDRVAHWTTINQPNILGIASYDNGLFPPCRCSFPFGVLNCAAGNSTVEPYVAVHNALLAHAAVVELYRTKYQAVQKGGVGINVYTMAYSPLTNSTADAQATGRVSDFMIGWILNPLVFGDYPEIMKKNAGPRIPTFTESQSKQLKGSFDFVGVNHYVSVFISDNPNGLISSLRDYNADMSVNFAVTRNETPSGQFVPTSITVDTPGLGRVLVYLKEAYGNPPIYVHENGYGSQHNGTLDDTDRIDAIRGYIGAVLSAIRKGTNVRGYLIWSFVDVFELLSGYQTEYGIYHVDFDDKDRKRRPKSSALWYRDFLRKKNQLITIQNASWLAPSHSSH